MNTDPKQNLNIYNFGIATDELYDNDAVLEPKIVSGIHVQSVFSPDEKIAAAFRDKYELHKGYIDFQQFLGGVDIVYIKMPLKDRYTYIKQAILAKKHIICDMPYTLEIEK